MRIGAAAAANQPSTAGWARVTAKRGEKEEGREEREEGRREKGEGRAQTAEGERRKAENRE
jgi:hypothetical protein